MLSLTVIQVLGDIGRRAEKEMTQFLDDVVQMELVEVEISSFHFLVPLNGPGP